MVTRTLHVCLRNGSMVGVPGSDSGQMGSPASVSSSVVFESFVQKGRPLWTRSVSPPGDSAGNGTAERAILTVENVLEGRDAGSRLTAWMVHHAAQVICACVVGADGLTPFRRLEERKFGTTPVGFGERGWLRDLVLERANKFNPRCTAARLHGFCLKSSRYIVVDFDGRFRMVRTIKRANADD